MPESKYDHLYPKTGTALTALLDEHGSLSGVARHIGVRPNTFHGYVGDHPELHQAVQAWRNTRTTAPRANALPPGPEDEVSAEEKLRLENAELRRRARRGRTDDVQFERVLDEIRAGVKSADVVYEPAHIAPDRVPGAHVHNLLFSDTHFGEKVDPVQVGGVNEYDTAICLDRMAHVHKALESFVKHRDYDFQKLTISALGDMVSGDPGIHDEIRESNEITGAEQAVWFGLEFGRFIEQLVPIYPLVEVLGVAGNHPRMAKPHASKNVFNSLDWIAYRVAETYLKNYIEAGSVTCNFPKSGIVIHEIVPGRFIYLFHGDGIRSSMPGVPWGGVMRRVNEIARQFAAQGIRIDQYQLGHFHSPNVVPGVLMNGALVGTNEFGLKNFGGGAPPTQLLATWNPRKSRMTDVSFITPR
jgi:hypothetical protein